MLLDVVYRQGRELRLEDVDNQTLQNVGRVLQSGALSCLRALSVSQTCVAGEESVVEFIACLDEKACSELQQLDLVFSGGRVAQGVRRSELRDRRREHPAAGGGDQGRLAAASAVLVAVGLLHHDELGHHAHQGAEGGGEAHAEAVHQDASVQHGAQLREPPPDPSAEEDAARTLA